MHSNNDGITDGKQESVSSHKGEIEQANNCAVSSSYSDLI